jgi:hypothetical protein
MARGNFSAARTREGWPWSAGKHLRSWSTERRRFRICHRQLSQRLLFSRLRSPADEAGSNESVAAHKRGGSSAETEGGSSSEAGEASDEETFVFIMCNCSPKKILSNYTVRTGTHLTFQYCKRRFVMLFSILPVPGLAARLRPHATPMTQYIVLEEGQVNRESSTFGKNFFSIPQWGEEKRCCSPLRLGGRRGLWVFGVILGLGAEGSDLTRLAWT